MFNVQNGTPTFLGVPINQISNYNKKLFDSLVQQKKEIVLDYDYSADMYVAKIFDGNIYSIEEI